MKINLKKTIITLGICSLTTLALAEDQYQNPMKSGINSHAGSMENSPMTAQSFVQDAATTDMKEIHMGEMALQKSDNSSVKSFARKLVADHTKASKKLEAIAMKEGLTFPDTNSMTWDMPSTNDGWHTNSGNYTDHSLWSTNTGVTMSENPNKNSPPHAGTVLASKETYVTNTGVSDSMNNRDMNSSAMNISSLSGAEFDRAFASHMVMGHEKAIAKFETAAANLQDQALKNYAEKTLPTLREHLRMAEALQSKVGMWSDSGMTNSMSNRNQ